MLELRPVCEHCGKDLPNGSTEAMICSFECTFCQECVQQLLKYVCPNCGGGFEKRPIRPTKFQMPNCLNHRPETHPKHRSRRSYYRKILHDYFNRNEP